MGMLRRRSISGGRTGGRPRPIEGLDKPVDDATENLSAKVPPTSAGVEGTVLGFTLYRKPPGYVPSSSVYGLLELMGLTGDWLVLISEIMFGERAAVMKTRRLEWRRNGREKSKSNEKANIVSST